VLCGNAGTDGQSPSEMDVKAFILGARRSRRPSRRTVGVAIWYWENLLILGL